MSTTRNVVFLLLLTAGVITAAPVPSDTTADPLPPGALARLGSDRLRNGGQVLGVAFAPDGMSLLGAGADGTVRVWSVTTGKETRLITAFPWSAKVVAFSADGTTLAVGSMGLGIGLFDAATG